MIAFSRRIGLNADAPRRRFPAETQILVAAHSAYFHAESQRKFEEALAAYSAAAEALATKGMAVGPKYLQQEAGLVAFSQNEPRVRAMNIVMARYQRNMSCGLDAESSDSSSQTVSHTE